MRLGHETLRKGHLAPTAIERAAECIKRFRLMAEARGAERIIAIATAAVREANNSKQFIKEIARQTGITVEILSGVEEARLIGLAASQGCSFSAITNLNVDIGGGSTEISLFRNGVPLRLYSVKLGAVALTETFLSADPPKSKEIASLKTEIRSAFERPARELRNQKWIKATGTSGTILALGAALRTFDTDPADLATQGAQPPETEVPLTKLAKINSALATMSVAERRRLVGISEQRSEIIVAGGQILEGVMRALGINLLRTCDWALREGAIIDYLREIEAEAQPITPDFSDQKLLGVHAVGRRFGYEEAHAHQVARLAEKIFAHVAPGAQLTRHQLTLMLAAALLHDVGYHIAHEFHHKHTLYLIQNSELTGFSESERAVIANIARYHRGSTPKDRHPEYAALNEADRDMVSKLGAIVRLADALDRSHEAKVADINISGNASSVQFQIESTLDCSNEVTEAERKKEMFEKAFDCSVEFITGRAKAAPKR